MKIDYVELPATDLERIKSFYRKAFDWEFEDWGPEYTAFCKKTAGLDGGFSKRATRPDPDATRGALVILFAEDLEAAEARVVEAGAEITERHVFPGGRRFHFIDPCGNELAIWANDESVSSS